MRFVGNHRQYIPKDLAYLFNYCELVDTKGWCIREVKTGYIERQCSPIFARLGLDTEQGRIEGWQRSEPYFNPPESQTHLSSKSLT
jgi:hypothetical protein